MTWKSPYLPWIAAVASGILLALCYPNWDRNELLWFWQAPLLAVLWLYPRPAHSLIAFRLYPRMPRILRGTWWGRILLLPVRGIDGILRGSAGEQARWKWGLKVGYLAGFVFFLINLFWLRHVAWPGMILLAAYLAVYFAFWGAFAASVGRLRVDRISPEDPQPPPARVQSEKLRRFMEKADKPNLLAPSLHSIWIAFLNGACWVALEWVRSWMFTGFGWNGLGVALHNSVNLIQVSDLVGVSGLAFLPVFLTCIGVSTVARFKLELAQGKLRPHLDFAVAMMLLILTFFYGVHSPRFHPSDDPVLLDAVLVQGNVSIEDRYNQAKAPEIRDLYEKLTSIYAQGDHDLIIWPETVLPNTFFENSTLGYLNHILGMGDFQLLIGNEQVILREDNELDIYNSMILMRDTTASYQAYHKMHRVPFGEYIPFRQSFPFFRWILGRLIPEDFDPGPRAKRIRLWEPDLELIPAICFEDTMGRLTRRFVQDEPTGAQIIINLTNDGWFNQSAANRQHLANAKFRCAELKRPMIRCANTGITCAIDRFGSLDDPDSRHPGDIRVLLDPVTHTPFFEGCYPVKMMIDSQPSTTVYARYGDWFAKLMTLITLLATLAASNLPWGKLQGLTQRFAKRGRG